jgi:hypothetical protein
MPLPERPALPPPVPPTPTAPGPLRPVAAMRPARALMAPPERPYLMLPEPPTRTALKASRLVKAQLESRSRAVPPAGPELLLPEARARGTTGVVAGDRTSVSAGAVGASRRAGDAVPIAARAGDTLGVAAGGCAVGAAAGTLAPGGQTRYFRSAGAGELAASRLRPAPQDAPEMLFRVLPAGGESGCAAALLMRHSWRYRVWRLENRQSYCCWSRRNRKHPSCH